MKKQIILQQCERDEIDALKKILLSHIKNYSNFNSFCKVAKDGCLIATSLLNNDYATFKKYSLKYTTHTAEKMRGLLSLSTYKRASNICRFLSACGGICQKCYAERSIKLYKASLEPVLIYNTLLLKYIEIDNAQIPYTNDRFFRFEAFSDLQSATHLKNLCKICKKNNLTTFALWSKAGYTLEKYMTEQNINKLPSNLNLINSEFYINQYKYSVNDLIALQSVLKTKNAIKNFIVYDDDEKRQNSGFYQCKNKCIDCLKCYKKSKTPVYIAERLH